MHERTTPTVFVKGWLDNLSFSIFYCMYFFLFIKKNTQSLKVTAEYNVCLLTD